ncbi:hypothetical protein HDU86_008343 [Geranomyces michiganensis]|nr:hypothetical protein HDU86_008343 [Geranomyces michiganensis]
MAGSFNVLLPGPPRPSARAALRESYSATTFPNVNPSAFTTEKQVATIRQMIADKINREKNKHLLLLSAVTADAVAYLAPDINAKELRLHQWNLLSTPGGQMFVSDADLASALELDEQTEEMETPSVEDSQIYYIRSWALTVDEVKEIMRAWQEEGLCPPELRFWRDAYHGRKPTDVMYFRYVGTARGPTTARQRFEEDLSERHAGFLMRFLDVFQQLNPSAYKRGRVFLFSEATLDAFSSRRERAEREVQIIAFLGFERLLNQDPGGSHYTPYSWEPEAE